MDTYLASIPFSLILPPFLPIPERMTSTPHTTNSSTFFSLRKDRSPLDHRFVQLQKSRESIDFRMEYHLFWRDAPVIILEIKTEPKLGLVSAREEADLQIRRCLRDLIGVCSFSKLHGGAISTKLCFYTAEDGRTITPLKIVADDQFTMDTAPRESWDCDVYQGS
ncbi:hypothetical protein BYT27DRAFT_6650883 [Phlegmacium glaucopus]|nr:hypothetical protein BYT27DRAFT_6650883 [Phlegmacium glaucopus]